MGGARYAIYFVPAAETALYRFGAAALGYDCYSGEEVALLAGVDRAWLSEPRQYGFHATLKAPFHLAAGASEAALTAAAGDFARQHAAFAAGDLCVREIGAFIALVPQTASAPLQRFADACVRDFDRFRAPMSESERTRRRKPTLTPQQIGNIERWGYPYVFADFRFHMTLTGSLAPEDRAAALRLLCDLFAQSPAAHALRIDRIVIAKQAGEAASFRVLHSLRLSG